METENVKMESTKERITGLAWQVLLAVPTT